jgi:creatinine amidohydrolase
MAADFKRLRGAQQLGFAWMASDLNPEGAVGEAASASAAKGEAAADHGADAFIELLGDVIAFDLKRLASGPLG